MDLARRVAARYRQALVMPPRKIDVFLSGFESRSKRILTKIQDIGVELKDVEGEDTLFESFRSLRRIFLYNLAKDVKSLTQDIDFMVDNWRRTWSGFTSIGHGLGGSLQSLTQIIEDASLGDKYENLFKAAKALTPQNIKDALEESDLVWNEKYEEGIPLKYVAKVEELGDAIRELLDLFKATGVRLRAYGSGDIKPEKVETLYHASINARSIYTNGFSLTVPDAGGLGGSQSDKSGNPSISFTYDLKAALEIARSFKEIALIIAGEISASDVLNWVSVDSDPQKVLAFLDSYGPRRKEVEGKGRTVLEYENGRWFVRSMAYRDDKPITFSVDEVYDKPIDVFNLYNGYLRTHPTRMDPFIMNGWRLLEHMGKTDPKDIGVVAAEVDMTDPDIESKHGEREYRVPPRAVKRVTRFY